MDVFEGPQEAPQMPDVNQGPAPSNAANHGCIVPPPPRSATKVDSTRCCWVLIGLELITKGWILCEERRRDPGQTLMHI